MEKLEVIGSKKLKGNIKISGSKNASLPILAATLISTKKIKIQNLPIVKDIQTMIFLLRSLGSNIKLSKNNNSIEIDNSKNIKIGKGIAIFIHLTKNYKTTAGCIALKKKDFLILLKIISKNTKIKIE